MLEIRLLIAKPNPKEDSLLFINNNPETFQGENKRGLREKIQNFFSNKAWLHEILAYGQPAWGPDKTIEELVIVEPIRFFCINDWEKIPENTELSIETHTLITLIMWLNSEHFKDKCESSRRCVICNEIQFGKPTGQMIGGFSSDVNKPPNNREMYARTSDHCLNPNCLSHEIEKMINPDYTIPKEAFKERGLNSTFIKNTNPYGS